VARLKTLHASCILSSNGGTKTIAGTAVEALAKVRRPYIASSIVMPRKYAGFTRLVVLIKYDLSAERFVRLGKASFHALKGFINLFPFMFPAHAKFF
jgi:hypothetical protein